MALGGIRGGTSRHPPSFCVAIMALLAPGWVWWRSLWPRWSRGDAVALCVAGVALGEIHRDFAWHLATSGVAIHDIHLLRDRRCTYGTGLAPVARLGATGRVVTPRHFAWQAWHLATSTFTLRGRRGAWRHQACQLRNRMVPSITSQYRATRDHCFVAWSPISDLVALAQRGKSSPEQKFDIFTVR